MADTLHMNTNPSRETVLAELKRCRDELLQLGVTDIRLFGSRARGDNREDSDIDVLIDYDESRKFSLIDLGLVEDFLAAKLGCPVHVTTTSSVPPSDRRRILAEAIAVL